jgi:alpha-amylase
VDTVKHVRKSFWPDFVRAAGVASMGEILHGSKSTKQTARVCF